MEEKQETKQLKEEPSGSEELKDSQPKTSTGTPKTLGSSEIGAKSSRRTTIKKIQPAVPVVISREEEDIDEFHAREIVFYLGDARPAWRLPVERGITDERYLKVLASDYAKLFKEDFELPDLSTLWHPDTVKYLGDVLNMTDYETNHITYWLLETLANILKRFQKEGMKMQDQKMSIIWITYIIKMISFYAFGREELFGFLEGLIRSGNTKAIETASIPDPYFLDELLAGFHDETLNNLDALSNRKESKPQTKAEKLSKLEVRDSDEKTNIKKKRDSSIIRGQSITAFIAKESELKTELDGVTEEMNKFFHMLIDEIYNIFGNRFKYEVIRHAYTNPPMITTITIQQVINTPRPTRSPVRTGLPSVNISSKKSIFRASRKSTARKSRKSIARKSMARKSRKSLARRKSRRSLSKGRLSGTPKKIDKKKSEFTQKILSMIMTEPISSTGEKVEFSYEFLIPLLEAENVNERFFEDIEKAIMGRNVKNVNNSTNDVQSDMKKSSTLSNKEYQDPKEVNKRYSV